MKVSPVATGGQPGVDIGAVSTSRSSPDRIAAAKAVASGQQPAEKGLEGLAEAMVRAQSKPKTIKMRTQVSPDRAFENTPQEPQTAASQENGNPDEVETSTDPAERRLIDPQLAAIAKARRAFQQEKAAFEEQKAKLTQSAPSLTKEELFGQLKLNPLGVLGEAGVSYDDLTQAILNGPTHSPEIAELKAKIAALEQGIDTKLTAREKAVEEQALLDMRKEAQRILQDPNAPFRMAKSREGLNNAIELIKRQYEDTREVISVDEALELVDKAMVEEHEEREKRLYPTGRNPQAPPQQQQNRGMRTLTNRDEATPVMSRRDRMLAAAHGTLKR